MQPRVVHPGSDEDVDDEELVLAIEEMRTMNAFAPPPVSKMLADYLGNRWRVLDYTGVERTAGRGS